MATFKTCIRKMRSDGYFPVYIRVTQDRKAEYLKTNLIVFYKDVKKGEIKDPYVIVEGASRIKHYINTLNQQNTESWSAKEIVDFLQYEGKDLSFTDYTNKYADQR